MLRILLRRCQSHRQVEADATVIGKSSLAQLSRHPHEELQRLTPQSALRQRALRPRVRDPVVHPQRADTMNVTGRILPPP
eukprot:9094303-Pyramimonas_sp.AAC.1